MSYILEALKKAEQKRRQGAVPDLLTVHDRPADKPGKQYAWIYIAASLLLAGGMVSAVLYKVLPAMTSNTRVPAAPPQPAQIALPVQAPAAPVPAQHVGRETARPATVQQPLPDETVRKVDLPDQRQASKQTVVLKESELPLAIQQELPRINISAHFYDADPAARIVSVRGNVLHEGQEVAAGLKLEKITPDGVVLSYKDYHFFRSAF